MIQNKFKKCLEQKKIILFSRGPKLASKELKLSLEDLKAARRAFKAGDHKWAIVQSYYSMFHSARALLYIKGYREKNHYCLIEAIRELYVNKRQLNFVLIEALQKAKILREDADYYGDHTKSGAKDLLKEAEEFLNEVKKIIEK